MFCLICMYKYLKYLCQVKLIIIVCCILLVSASDINSNKHNEELFKQLFKLRRAEQLEAVKKITHFQEHNKHKMVKTISKTLFDVILSSRVVLESSGYVPGVSQFPETEAVKDALSVILENTALMGELVLRLPDVVEPVLQSSSEWSNIFAWSLTFANQTQLLDSNTVTLIYLVGQELNLTARSPDYINPYRQIKSKVMEEQNKERIKKKKKKPLPRGPRLSLPQAGEL